MKKVIFLAAGLLFAAFIQAQEKNVQFTSKQDSALKHFVVLYKTGKNWDAAKAPGQQPYFTEHSRFLADLRKRAVIKAGARYSDVGMLIISATNLETAEALIKPDLAVIHETFSVSIHEAGFFYKGCIE